MLDSEAPGPSSTAIVGRATRRLATLATAIAAVLVVGDARAVQHPPARFGDGVCALAEGTCRPRPVLAVLAAFPAELEPLLERATVLETLAVGDRVLRVGTLADVPVVLGLLGIGLVNAGATTRLVLDRFDVGGVVVSGVAGSPRPIGDVTVPVAWTDASGAVYPADPAMIDVARAIAAAGVALERCTMPPRPPRPTVCLGHEPALVVGGIGRSSDPLFGDQPFPCVPESDDVIGCDVRSAETAAARSAAAFTAETSEEPVAVDMETAAVAREAQARGLKFIAFRAVSDGPGDPLGLPGYPAQFFAYYRLAARNAAAAAAAFVEQWGAGHSVRVATGALEVRASCGWQRRATPACAPNRRAPRALRARVDRACRLLADENASAAAVARAWRRAARLAAQPAVRARLGRTCARELAAALRDRASP